MSKASLLMLGTAAFVVAGVTASKKAESADHKDAPGAVADPASDINDVFSFVDGGKVILGMTVFPFATTEAKFSSSTKYVFHTTSGTAFGETKASKDVICTFDAAQKISCWVGTDDYVTGDASAPAGISSTSGKVKVFAGKRADPFYFNLQGFKDTVKTVETAAPSLMSDGSGCPAVDATTSTALVNMLQETTSTDPMASTKTTADDFGAANTLAIVLSLDASLVTSGGKILSVWGSTNK
jgi:hypothetical protein